MVKAYAGPTTLFGRVEYRELVTSMIQGVPKRHSTGFEFSVTCLCMYKRAYVCRKHPYVCMCVCTVKMNEHFYVRMYTSFLNLKRHGKLEIKICNLSNLYVNSHKICYLPIHFLRCEIMTFHSFLSSVTLNIFHSSYSLLLLFSYLFAK